MSRCTLTFIPPQLGQAAATLTWISGRTWMDGYTEKLSNCPKMIPCIQFKFNIRFIKIEFL